jgi:hypothetical protein
LTTVRVVLPSGGQQVTEWVYGVTTSGGSGLNSNDLVKEVRYPDPSTGASSSSSKDVLTVNALGQAISDGSGPTGRSFFVFPLLGLAVLVVTVEKDFVGIGQGPLIG